MDLNFNHIIHNHDNSTDILMTEIQTEKDKSGQIDFSQ